MFDEMRLNRIWCVVRVIAIHSYGNITPWSQQAQSHPSASTSARMNQAWPCNIAMLSVSLEGGITDLCALSQNTEPILLRCIHLRFFVYRVQNLSLFWEGWANSLAWTSGHRAWNLSINFGNKKSFHHSFFIELNHALFRPQELRWCRWNQS